MAKSDAQIQLLIEYVHMLNTVPRTPDGPDGAFMVLATQEAIRLLHKEQIGALPPGMEAVAGAGTQPGTSAPKS